MKFRLQIEVVILLLFSLSAIGIFIFKNLHIFITVHFMYVLNLRITLQSMEKNINFKPQLFSFFSVQNCVIFIYYIILRLQRNLNWDLKTME